MIIKNNPYEKAGKPIPGKEQEWINFRSLHRSNNNPFLSARGGPLKGKEKSFFDYLDDSRKEYLADLRLIPKEQSKKIKERDAEFRRRMNSEGTISPP